MAKYKIIPSSRNIVQSPISIGHKAEKGVEAIEFDLTAWVETYGSGTLTVIMRRWGDAIPYPIALEIDENNKATWTLSDTDTAKAGMAYAQLSYIVGETVVKKSDIYTFRVMDSLTGEGEPPEAYESWLEHLTHLAAEAMAEVLDIEGVATDKTLTVDGGIADAKATGEALAEKVDAADYSSLSARVGANTIALAEKADRSTTYTKTEVDALIDEVEVETDTTLEIAGAPADAKKVGDELSDIKADLDAVENVLDDVGSVFKQGLNGHTWSVLGDSITDANSTIAIDNHYYHFIKRRNPNLIYNAYGVSGNRMAAMAGRYQNMNYSDIITVFGGVNDWGQNNPTPLGTIDDTGTSTFYGALNTLCTGLLTEFPLSLIIFITPLGNNGFGSFPTDKNSLGLSIYDYTDAIIACCAKYKIPVLDICRNSMLNPQFAGLKEAYFYDGLHLNPKGHEVLSYLIESEMLKHYIPVVSDIDNQGRLLTIEDVDSNIGIDNLVVKNGTLTYGTSRGNCILLFKSSVKRIRFTYVVTAGGRPGAIEWTAFGLNGTTVYCTDGYNSFKFAVSSNKYSATKDNTLAVVKDPNSINFAQNINKRAEIVIENGVQSLYLNDVLIMTVTNSTRIGFWGSDTIRFRLENVRVYED